MRVYELQERGIDGIVMVDRPKPKPGPTDVVVRVKAVSLNYRDLIVLRGDNGPRRPNMVPVSDGVGEVVRVGSRVSRFTIGERVAGIFMQGWLGGRLQPESEATGLGGAIDGMLAEYVVLNEEGLVRVPEHLTDEEAATLPCAGVTAWNALFATGNVRAGDSVLIQGTGGVSIFAIQFARLAGARVLVTSSSDQKLGQARRLGAEVTHNYRTNPEWDRWALEVTAGAGVDHVIEVGGPETFARSLNAVRREGTVSVIGVLTGESGNVSTADIMWKQIRVTGVLVGSREVFEQMNEAIVASGLRPVIDRVFRFEEARDAYRYLESGGHFGKVVIRVGDN
jgi:NADPH:quinone reductase-like Zn-dependent oxidoreductase